MKLSCMSTKLKMTAFFGGHFQTREQTEMISHDALHYTIFGENQTQQVSTNASPIYKTFELKEAAPSFTFSHVQLNPQHFDGACK